MEVLRAAKSPTARTLIDMLPEAAPLPAPLQTLMSMAWEDAAGILEDIISLQVHQTEVTMKGLMGAIQTSTHMRIITAVTECDKVTVRYRVLYKIM